MGLGWVGVELRWGWLGLGGVEVGLGGSGVRRVGVGVGVVWFGSVGWSWIGVDLGSM